MKTRFLLILLAILLAGNCFGQVVIKELSGGPGRRGNTFIGPGYGVSHGGFGIMIQQQLKVKNLQTGFHGGIGLYIPYRDAFFAYSLGMKLYMSKIAYLNFQYATFGWSTTIVREYQSLSSTGISRQVHNPLNGFGISAGVDFLFTKSIGFNLGVGVFPINLNATNLIENILPVVDMGLYFKIDHN